MVDYTVVLSTRGFKFEGILQNVDQSTFSHVENLNSANEVSFTVYKKLSENILTNHKQSDIVNITNQGGTNQCTKDF